MKFINKPRIMKTVKSTKNSKKSNSKLFNDYKLAKYKKKSVS